ncbi:hypothetical protein ACFQV2_20685 [Actinokineospora soli]|uniref:Uncharacterized protein n=1 Tax=Actinokineospora soli TaxID=1048753 RepID=A0ABW2TRM4_9PSEU
MLYLDAPIGPIDGLMVYRDHADPSLFYYVPERPRLAVNDGVPEFQLLVYRRDISDNPDLSEADRQKLGGGFLAFTVDLGVTEEQLKEVRKQLAAHSGGTVKLTPSRSTTARSGSPSPRTSPTRPAPPRTPNAASTSSRKSSTAANRR